MFKDTLIPIFLLGDSSYEDAARSNLADRSEMCKFAPRILRYPPQLHDIAFQQRSCMGTRSSTHISFTDSSRLRETSYEDAARSNLEESREMHREMQVRTPSPFSGMKVSSHCANLSSSIVPLLCSNRLRLLWHDILKNAAKTTIFGHSRLFIDGNSNCSDLENAQMKGDAISRSARWRAPPKMAVLHDCLSSDSKNVKVTSHDFPPVSTDFNARRIRIIEFILNEIVMVGAFEAPPGTRLRA